MPNCNLGLCVLASDAAHHIRSFCRRKDVQIRFRELA
jgi:hypothetical protein